LKLAPLLASALFVGFWVPSLGPSAIAQTSLERSNLTAESYNLGEQPLSLTFADAGPIQEGGSFDYPGIGTISYDAGTRPEDLFTVGMMDSFGFKNASLDQIGSVTGQDVSNAPLSEFEAVHNLTVQQLVDTVPGLGNTPLSDVPPIQDLARQQGVYGDSGGGTVGSVAPMIQGGIGQLGSKLVSYGISQIPGLSNISLGKIPGIDSQAISSIPGLSSFPLFNPLSLKDYFVKYDIPFGMSECAMGMDCHERNIDNTASGNEENTSISCTGKEQSCAHIEIRRNFGNPTDKSRWVSKEHKVPGGSGLGAAICDEEPTGRFPLGKNPKVVLEKIKEKSGKIVFALYFSVHVDLDESDSAHCFGPFSMPLFGSAKENDWILFGPDGVAKDSPFAGLGGNGPSGSASCSTQSVDKPKEKYGHKAHNEADSDDLTTVATPAGLGRTETLHKDAATAFDKMAQDAAKEGVFLTVVSGHRPESEQQTLFDQQVAKQGSEEKAAKISAPAGYSEHATGYALDVGNGNDVNLNASFESTPAYKWLNENATKYGFTQSFNGGANQGADNEPWHWRYEGTAAAKAEFSSATPTNATNGQSGGCQSSGYGGSCVASDGKTSATYKGVDIAAFKNAIGNVESRGSGGYKAIGIWVDDGAGNQGRGLGKYQFMSYGPAKDIISQKAGGAQFLVAMNSPDLNTSDFAAQTEKLFTPQEQEALMDSQIKRLADVGASQGYQGDALLRRMAEMHEGGEGVRDGVDKDYSDSVIADYKKGGVCVAGDGNATGKLRWPTKNPDITSGFGSRDAPLAGASKFHEAIDLAGNIGDPVVATDGGIVAFAGDAGNCGNMIVIDHKNGFTSQYCHLNKILVSVGTPISANQRIGDVGTTGNSTGPHLHFVLKKNGVPIDPTPYLRGK
jgi:D-alanyl-D-alanine dipeptidase